MISKKLYSEINLNRIKFLKKQGVKMGVLDWVKLDGLVPKELYKETKYIDPILVANKVSDKLKK